MRKILLATTALVAVTGVLMQKYQSMVTTNLVMSLSLTIRHLT